MFKKQNKQKLSLKLLHFKHIIHSLWYKWCLLYKRGNTTLDDKNNSEIVTNLKADLLRFLSQLIKLIVVVHSFLNAVLAK